MEKQLLKISKLSDKELQKYLLKTDIDFLHKVKLYVDDIYYNTGDDPILSDYQYDILKETIQELDINYTVSIGAKARPDDNKVILPFWLGSMNKLKPEDETELKRWIEKNKSSEYIIEHKLDGISCLLSTNKGKISLYTRGDGAIGSNISHLAHLIKIGKDIDIEDMYVRGELIIKKSIFEDKFSSEFANPRNFVAGRVGSKTIRKGIEDIEFIAYEIVSKGVLVKPQNQLEYLQSLGFNTVEHIIIPEITKEILLEYFILSKTQSDYEIDGIIVQPNVPYVRNITGNPSYAFAFKVRLDSNIIEAVVEEVEWNISKWGLIKPRIRITPVNLNGVTITYTSGFNAKYILDNNIGENTIIKLTRSGDVIPFITEVVKSTEAQMPNIPYKWNETQVDIYTEENENIMCVKLVSSFFASLKIKHVSEATVSKMYNHGLDNVLKIVAATKEDFEKIEGFGKRLAERTYDNIHEGLQNVSIPLLLGASGVFGMGMGTRKVESLFQAIPDILDIYKTISKEELVELVNNVEGFSDKTTSKIVENLPWADKFIDNIKPYIKLKIVFKLSNDLKDMKVVFSGFRDKNLEEIIKQRGGKVVTSVSKNTNTLVVADKDSSSSKITKAIELGIDIYDKEEFLELINL